MPNKLIKNYAKLYAAVGETYRDAAVAAEGEDLLEFLVRGKAAYEHAVRLHDSIIDAVRLLSRVTPGLLPPVEELDSKLGALLNDQTQPINRAVQASIDELVAAMGEVFDG